MSTIKTYFLSACVLVFGAAWSGFAAAQLSLAPSNPTPLDVVRLRWTHVGCTNPDSLRVAMQANLVTVSADRIFLVDCGTTQGYYDEYTVGRLPTGEYDVQLVVNPPPPTLGPSQLIGPIHLSVGALPPTGSLLPHDDYSDVWSDPAVAGTVLTVKQSGDKLVAAWSVYDATGRPTWYFLWPGSWTRDSGNNLRFSGSLYMSSGPYWGDPLQPHPLFVAAVGTASFIPQAPNRARFEYTIGAVSGAMQLVRFVF